MYFDFDDRYTGVDPVGHAISRREGIVMSVVVHVAVIGALLMLPPLTRTPSEGQEEVIERLQPAPEEDEARFVFVQPQVDMPAEQPPERAELSDLDRRAQAPELPTESTNPLPFARGNSRGAGGIGAGIAGPRRGPVAGAIRARARAGRGTDRTAPRDGGSRIALAPARGARTAAGRLARGGAQEPAGVRAARVVQQPAGRHERVRPAHPVRHEGRRVRTVDPPLRRAGAPELVRAERRHADERPRRDQFNVHKDGRITDLTVVAPANVESFNTPRSMPRCRRIPPTPLPPEYPADKAFFTVTFYYNESPGQRQ